MTPAELRAAADRVLADPSFQYDGWYDDLLLVVDAANDLADIQEAWLNPGPRPDYHEHVKGFTRRRWPTLTDAIERSLP